MTIKQTYLPLFLLDSLDIMLLDLKGFLKKENLYKFEVKQEVNKLHILFKGKYDVILKRIEETEYAEEFGDVSDDFIEHTSLNDYNNSNDLLNKIHCVIMLLKEYDFINLEMDFVIKLYNYVNRIMNFLKVEYKSEIISDKINDFKLWKNEKNN